MFIRLASLCERHSRKLKILARLFYALAAIVMIANTSAFGMLPRLRSSLALIDWITAGLLILALIFAPFYFSKTGEDSPSTRFPRFAFYTGTLLLALYFFGDKTTTPAGAILISTMFATIGWVSNQDASRKATLKAAESAAAMTRKQHTMTTLMRSRENRVLQYHSANMLDYYPADVRVAEAHIPAILKQRDDWSHFQEGRQFPSYSYYGSFAVVANYWEYIAAGIRSGDLDEAMLKNMSRGVVVNFHEKNIHLINKIRGVSGDFIAQPAALEHLTWLVAKWKTPTDGKQKREMPLPSKLKEYWA